MTKISVHDNDVLGYSVDCVKREIHLHTLYQGAEPNEYTDVLFTGVVAYHFESENLGTILFDIYEEPLEHIVAAYRNLFASRKKYGWPDGMYGYETEADLIAELRRRNIKGYDIMSSCGMDGFVLAQEMRKILLKTVQP